MVKGLDDPNYLLIVKETIKYDKKNFGAPSLTFNSTYILMFGVHSQLIKNTGIIIFDVAGWGDATGHVTLWNGSTCGDSCYFNPHAPVRTDKIIFWEIE